MKINTDGILLGAWVNIEEEGMYLDIGAGTGVIAIMLAQRSKGTKIIGVEIDEISAEECSENMMNSPWADRLQVMNTPIQDYARSVSLKFDHIVSNPPFFSGGTFSKSQERNLVKHTIKLPHGELLSSVIRLLDKEGYFSLILPYIEGLRFVELAEQYNLYLVRKCEVSSFSDSPIERLLLTFSKTKKENTAEYLYIREKNLSYSKDYISLTKAYYLKM